MANLKSSRKANNFSAVYFYFNSHESFSKTLIKSSARFNTVSSTVSFYGKKKELKAHSRQASLSIHVGLFEFESS